jgi:transcriptional regulator with XRE-family HTH domain
MRVYFPELSLSNLSFPQEAPVGRNKRWIPAKLGQKLKAIREHLGLTQEQMIERLDCPLIPLHTGAITNYEKNVRDPSSIVLLHYARLVKVHIDDLVDDKIDLNLK